MADTSAGAVYEISGNFTPRTAYTSSTNKGFIGTIDPEDGTISPLVSGFSSPHGLGLVPSSASTLG